MPCSIRDWSSALKGHGFSRAEERVNKGRGLSPSPSSIALKGHGFSRAEERVNKGRGFSPSPSLIGLKGHGFSRADERVNKGRGFSPDHNRSLMRGGPIHPAFSAAAGGCDTLSP